MAMSLLETFGSLEQETKDALADLSSPLLLSFCVLDIAHEKCGVERLSAEHITACLEAAGVAVPKKSISRALARAQDRVSKTRDTLEGEVLYRLMTKGKREISTLLGGGLLSVVRIESNKPRTAAIRLGDALSQLRGLVRICDPYYGVRTLDSLDHIPPRCNVRFLTGRTSEMGRKLNSALRDFKRERPKVQIRLAAKPEELHDRYVVTHDQLVILGHGLKDIGGKESFMLRLSRGIVPDLIKETIGVFDSRWVDARPI